MKTAKNTNRCNKFPVREKKQDSAGYEKEYEVLKDQEPEEQMAHFRNTLAGLDRSEQEAITNLVTLLAHSGIKGLGTGAALELIFKLGVFLALQTKQPAPSPKENAPLPEAA